MQYLCVGAIFKNEKLIMKEWLEHYIREGVDHFVLVDNGSDDDYMQVLEPFIAQGIVTLFADTAVYAQVKFYNRYVRKIGRSFEWILIVDFDEFVYARKNHSSIKSYLSRLDQKVGQVLIPWKIFGSSAHIQQPASVLESFTERSHYDGQQKQGMIDGMHGLGKYLVRSRYLLRLLPHKAIVLPWCHEITSDNTLIFTGTADVVEESLGKKNYYDYKERDWRTELYVSFRRHDRDDKRQRQMEREKYRKDRDSGTQEQPLIVDELDELNQHPHEAVRKSSMRMRGHSVRSALRRDKRERRGSH